jgi:hypothetical protein
MTHSPLLGFNNNVKHRGRLFHIQTEDSGIRHPHVITHLFMDGGRILKTVKTSYAEHVGSDRLAQLVRELMKEQHKTMFIALRDGKFDHVLESAPPPSGVGAVSAAPQSSASLGPPGRISTSTNPVAQRPGSPVSAPMKTAGPARDPSGTATGVRPAQRREAPELFGGRPAEAAAVNVVGEERQASGAETTSSEPKEQPGSGRYVAPRPAAIFASGRNPEAGGSIFGDDLISEKSLDEVILSYLSDDLDSTSPKK